MTDEDGYEGPATLRFSDGHTIDVDVKLRGHFQPIDGRYHWYGRVTPNDALNEVTTGRKMAITIRTPEGEADGHLSDPDTWGRYRITGTSTPPFTIETADAHADV